jgi:hypothetical protein
LARENILFAQPSSLEQRTLQSIAHSLNLEYEYSIAIRNVTISRPVRQVTGPVTGFEAPGVENVKISLPFNTENSIPIDVAFLDAVQVHAPAFGREFAIGEVLASRGTREPSFSYVLVSEVASDLGVNIVPSTAPIKDIRSDPYDARARQPPHHSLVEEEIF